MYIDHQAAVMEADGDDAQVLHHREYALRPYLVYLVDTSIFVNESDYYV